MPKLEKPKPLFDLIDLFGWLFIATIIGPNLTRHKVRIINVTDL